MADHNVTLTYTQDGGAVIADPFTITVSPGQTVAFHLAAGTAAGKIRITFPDRKYFATNDPYFQETGVFHDGDGEVRVVSALHDRTTYHCELLNEAGSVIGRSHEGGGGDVLPAS